jgi:hypothetical protein
MLNTCRRKRWIPEAHFLRNFRWLGAPIEVPFFLAPPLQTPLIRIQGARYWGRDRADCWTDARPCLYPVGITACLYTA